MEFLCLKYWPETKWIFLNVLRDRFGERTGRI